MVFSGHLADGRFGGMIEFERSSVSSSPPIPSEIPSKPKRFAPAVPRVSRSGAHYMHHRARSSPHGCPVSSDELSRANQSFFGTRSNCFWGSFPFGLQSDLLAAAAFEIPTRLAPSFTSRRNHGQGSTLRFFLAPFIARIGLRVDSNTPPPILVPLFERIQINGG